MKYPSKRTKPRFSINIDGYYLYNNEWEKCRIYDLNLEGAGLNYRHSFKEGDKIKIKFDESDEHIFKAAIKNQKSKRIGIVFINNSGKDLIYLKQIINDCSNRYKI